MTPKRLLAAAQRFGTPLYAYDLDAAVARARLLADLFGGRFGISYAIKANPNAALLRALRPQCTSFDASSFAEVRRGLAAGMPAQRLSFSGPAKRPAEIEAAVAAGVGELVVESLAEAQAASAAASARGRRQPVLARLNPLTLPAGFAASMSVGPSQFGIDEEAMSDVLPAMVALTGIELVGFHAYSGTNSLDAFAIAQNFGIFIDLFRRAQALCGIRPRALVFGAGFGVPYLPADQPLDHDALPAMVNPMLDALRAEPAFADAALTLELGRWLIGPAGWLLTSVVAAKHSRGVEIRACDAGFNNHLAACGMMGSVIKRHWRFANLSNPHGPPGRYMLVGPLCTTIDRLAASIELPEVRVGDVLAIEQSGAYGLSASPVKFISHPEPREAAWQGGAWHDVSETLLNHWMAAPPDAPAEPDQPGAPGSGPGPPAMP